MALTLYKKKRNFKKTSEPVGAHAKGSSKLIFVVQRHNASHLHYDFRLEMEGVLKSWAVPKGPSMNPGDKRLAVMVEDHPYSYKDFEGTIPKGNYGAGTVEIWDKGYYTDLNQSDKKESEKALLKELKSGSIKFVMHGEKLKGEFALVRMKNTDNDKSWLLIKHNDDYAVKKSYTAETAKESKPDNQAVNKKPLERKLLTDLKKKKTSGLIKPMLAKETDKAFDDKEWLFEIKWDGYRAIAELEGKDVSLYSRNGNNFNTAYPFVVAQLKKMNLNATLDGEITVLNLKGLPDFQLLQDYKMDNSHPIQYNVFDLLSLNGKDTCELPLIERKKLLQKLLPNNEIIKYSDHTETNGKGLYKEATKLNLEGIMAKKANSLYYPGRRTSEWLKIKEHKTQDAIIAGFTQGRNSRKHFGALILAVKKGNTLNYIGHTGTGFDEKKLEDMMRLLKPLIRKTSPFNKRIVTNMPVTWVEPKLVCEVKYTQQTQRGSLRHPVFLHLRPDKPKEEVTEEKAITPVKTKKNEAESGESNYSFEKIEVPVTHTQKLFWPDDKITKGDLINYYQSIANVILPYLKNRPQSLRRNPNGIKDDGFFQKDASKETPDWIETHKIYSESANKEINYILCNDKATLCYLNNLGCIELNPWHSTIKHLDNPDYLVIDIDPSKKNTFEQVIETALAIHEVFEKMKIPHFCKTSGATGMHVYVPTQQKYTYDQLKDFSHLVCIRVNEMLPRFTSLERNLQKRGNTIYLDYLQNRRGQTIASAYSVRPFPGATVSTPLEWKEVKKGLDPSQFNIHNTAKRLQKKGDLFAGVLGKGIDLLKCLKIFS